MAQSGDVRRKLEAAVRSSQQSQPRAKVEVLSAKATAAQTPTIKLKTDFSHFST